MTETLGIFAKFPTPGRVKTRLARTVGVKAAAELYDAFVRDSVARFRLVGENHIFGYAPNEHHAWQWADATAGGKYDLWPQPNGDLGRRMHAFFKHAFSNGAQRVVLLGSDSPNVPLSLVTAAFNKLRTHDIVIGPAVDGGYYLIGQRAPGFDIFRETAWSTSRVLEQTTAQVFNACASLALLDAWYDIDCEDDARKLLTALSDSPTSDLPATQRKLSDLFA